MRKHDTASSHWQGLHTAVYFRHILGFHRRIAGGEIHRPVHEALHAAAAADRLIVDLHVGLCGTKRFEPLQVERGRKTGARSLQFDVLGAAATASARAEGDKGGRKHNADVVLGHRYSYTDVHSRGLESLTIN